jgi:hypothetical protein
MRKALAIGIDDYSLAPLAGCVNDASAMATVLRTHGDGSPNFDVKLITSPSEQLGRARLRAEIEKLFQGVADIALLYFSGHGVLKSTGGYIVSTDFKQYDEGVSMDEILSLANESRANDKIVLFDCCHSGAFGTPAIAKTTALLSDGLTVLTASRDNEAALEVGGNGVFTRLVVSALEGGAADLGGNVTPGSIYSYVDQALGAWDQRPIFKTNVSRFTKVRTVSPRVPPATLRKLATYFKAPQDEYALDASYEDTGPAPDAANVAIMKDLQKLQSVGLVVPVDAEFMYFAAMHSKSCKLTALGAHYWRLVNEKRL